MNLGGSIKINKCGLSVLAFVIFIFIIYHLSGSSKGDQSPLVAPTNEISLRKLLIGAIRAAELGGEEVLKVYNSKILNTQSKGKTKEGVNDPVTDADFFSHCTMTKALHHLFPKILKVVSEEGHAKEKCPEIEINHQFDLNPTVLGDSTIPDISIPADQVSVWIDPLDATKEFTENLTEYVTTMVCVAVNGKPVIGVIHNPFPKNRETTWAWEGHAYSHDLASRKKGEESKGPVLIVSRSHAGTIKDVAKNIFGEKVEIVKAAGAGYKVLKVIFDNAIYMHNTVIKKWDLCAGNAILNALGGKMTDFKGNELLYLDDGNYVHSTGLLATMSKHETYVEKLKDVKLA
ncbi:putative inositol monophosphatase 3 [Culicoides brevitarsis]|uniref:putative inositol monophosphatase 3 n=1 Tax=Culicoides brevitarsis TaxID=469753 RepID=UPI00307BC626